MAKDHSYSKRGIPLPPIHGLLFQLAARSLLYIYTITQSSIYKGLCFANDAALPITNTFMLCILSSLLCRCLYILCDWKMKVVFHSTVYMTGLIVTNTFLCFDWSQCWCKLCSICGKEGNGLFNDALNTFYLRLYGVRYMVKDHSDSEKGNPLPPHRLLFTINNKGSFICTIPQTG